MAFTRHSHLPLLMDYYQRLLQLATSPTSPLLADGLDIHTLQPVHWTYPDGQRVPMSNFASQQNFLRGLTALSILTQDPGFDQQARHITAYFLDHYVDDASGLFHWAAIGLFIGRTAILKARPAKSAYTNSNTIFRSMPFYIRSIRRKPKLFSKGSGLRTSPIGKSSTSAVTASTASLLHPICLPTTSPSRWLTPRSGLHCPKRLA